jgi:hypothetical protein
MRYFSTSPQLLQQDKDVLWRQVREAEDRAGEVNEFFVGEGVLGQPGLERLVAIESAPRVGEELGRSGKEHSEAVG